MNRVMETRKLNPHVSESIMQIFPDIYHVTSLDNIPSIFQDRHLLNYYWLNGCKHEYHKNDLNENENYYWSHPEKPENFGPQGQRFTPMSNELSQKLDEIEVECEPKFSKNCFVKLASDLDSKQLHTMTKNIRIPVVINIKKEILIELGLYEYVLFSNINSASPKAIIDNNPYTFLNSKSKEREILIPECIPGDYFDSFELFSMKSKKSVIKSDIEKFDSVMLGQSGKSERYVTPQGGWDPWGTTYYDSSGKLTSYEYKPHNKWLALNLNSGPPWGRETFLG